MKVSCGVLVKTLIVVYLVFTIVDCKNSTTEDKTLVSSKHDQSQSSKGVKRSTAEGNLKNHQRKAREYAESSYNPSALEAPEPIIEIIIKESNETSPHAYAPLPVGPTHKKKEEVQVFYVNYKKDKNNKLQLETPIAALSPTAYKQSAADEEDVPSYHHVPTALPLLKSTTLRTIIHPDSEKYHSNSGIHVTFGSENHQRSGYHFQEQNAESVIQNVVARPDNNDQRHHIPSSRISFESNLHNPVQNTLPNPGPPPHFHTDTFNRPFHNQNQNFQYRGPAHPGQLHLQQQQYQQQPHTYQQPNLHQQQNLQPQFPPQQQSHVYHHQQFPTHNFQNQAFKQPAHKTQPNFQPQSERNNALYRPHGPPHTQNTQQFYNPITQYPILGPKRIPPGHKPIPIPLQGISSTKDEQPLNRPTLFDSQNRPPFTFQSVPNAQQNRHQTSLYNQTHNTAFPPPINHANRFSSQVSGQREHVNFAPSLNLNGRNQNYQGGHQFHQPNPVSVFKGSEVLKSVPKFEQHITETVPINQHNSQLSLLNAHTNFTSTEFHHQNDQNNVIRNIPAPQLGTPAPNLSNTGHNGNYHQTSGQIVHPNHQYNQNQPSIVYSQNANHLYPSFTSQSSKGNSQPGQSVSTFHTEAFRDIEQRQKNYYNGNSGQTSVQERTKTQHSTSQSTTSAPQHETTTEKKPVDEQTLQKNAAKLPDEVPDDLRQQLLSSGILANADISILDYDKVGDIDLENLPPEHLANFYNNGGESQISASNKVLSYAKTNGETIKFGQKHNNKLKDTESLSHKQNIDLKVVQFNSNTQKTVSDRYIQNQSTVLPAVDINNKKYHNYLPFKIDGALFPIPEAEELKNRKISSVVVLAPIDTLHMTNQHDHNKTEHGQKPRNIKFFAGDTLNELIRKPSKQNFKAWLDTESKHELEAQSVILLVAKNSNDEQDIFMYDISNKSVNKLNGNISMTFVKVAEANSLHQDLKSESSSEIQNTDSSISTTQ